jgi:hypothetical protein
LVISRRRSAAAFICSRAPRFPTLPVAPALDEFIGPER